ncbi:MAG: DUF262 domain-containing protein [Nitrospirae bacterium YQR-1]
MEGTMEINSIVESNQSGDNVEGYDRLPSDALGEYPIDNILIRTQSRTVYDVLRRIKAGQFILNPDFQRDFVWEVDKQSKLIESVLMRIPLPVLYLAEREDGMTVVVDGLQRLTTFYRFHNNEFSLKGLVDPRKNLNGKTFAALHPKFQNRIEDTNLILYIIDSKVPEQARLDIFERVNGGVPLSRQQMRNCIYMGKATNWLKECAQNEIFKKATGDSLDSKTMRDRECINRFCGFYLLGTNTYDGNMDSFLAETLKHMNKMTDDELKGLSDIFYQSMENNYLVFGKHAFRKHSNPEQARNIINVSLFDVYSVFMAKYKKEMIAANADLIHNAFYKTMENQDFVASITSGTNDKKRVNTRFSYTENAFKEVLG